MMKVSSLLFNRTPETQSDAAGARSSSVRWFTFMPQAAIAIGVVKAPKYTSSGVR